MKTVGILLTLSIEDYMLPCFTKTIMGFDCPGCGLQRSAAFIMQGKFLAAWEMYPAIFTIIPLLGFLALNQFFQIKYANKIIISLVIVTVGLILTNYILKFL